MEAPQQLLQALQALYGTDVGQQAAANQWIQHYSTTPAAWEGSVALLSSSYPVDVQFFGANMLLTKVRNDWGELSEQHQELIGNIVRQRCTAELQSPSESRFLTQRLGMAGAAVAVAGGGDSVRQWVAQAQAAAQSSNPAWVLAGVCFLYGLADHVSSMPSSRVPSGPKSMCAAELAGVLGTLADVIVRTRDSDDVTCAAAVSCVLLMLQTNTIQRLPASLGGMAAEQAPLFSALLQCLSSHSATLLEQASDVLLLLVSGEGGGCPGQEGGARQLLQQLISQQPRLVDPDDPLQGHAAQLAAAFAEEDPDMAAGGLPEAVPLAEAMLRCLQSASRGRQPALLRFLAEYFYLLCVVPPLERPEALRSPLYSGLLQALLPRLVSYPEGFTNWQECVDEDPDDFQEFRSMSAADLLSVCYPQLHGSYCAYVGHLLQQAQVSGDWRGMEAALWAMTCVSEEVMSWVFSSDEGGNSNASPPTPGNPPGPQQQAAANGPGAANPPPGGDEDDRLATQSFLLSLLTGLLGGGLGGLPAQQRQLGGGGGSYLVSGAARLVAAYASWFGCIVEAPLHAALQYLLQGVTAVPEASHTCATAFKALCYQCTQLMTDAQAVGALIGPVLQAATDAPDPLSRAPLLEGIARVVAELPQQQQVCQLSVQLVQPFVRSGQESLARAQSPETAAALERQLRAVHVVLAALETSVQAQHWQQQQRQQQQQGAADALQQQLPAGAVMQAAAPLLEGVASSPALQGSEGVISAAAGVYGAGVRCCGSGPAGQALVGPLLSLLVPAFATHRHAAALEAISDVVGVFAQQPGAAPMLEDCLRQVAAAAVPLFQGDLAANAATVANLLELADTYLVQLPGTFCGGGQGGEELASGLLTWAAAALRLRDAAAVKAALSFVSHAVTPQGGPAVRANATAAASSPQLQRLVVQHAPALTSALLAAAVDTCPRGVLRALSSCLYCLLAHPSAGAAAGAQLVSEVALVQDFGGMAEHQFPQQDRQRFASLMTRLPPLPAPRFAALVSDFALIFRGERSPDTVLAYEL